MKKYIKDLKTLSEVIMFGLLYLSITMFKNSLYSFLILGLWLIYCTYNLFSKYNYRKGKSEYLLIPTKNDDFYKMSSIIIGLITIAISVSAIIWTRKLNFYEFIGLIAGLLILLNGVFDVPKVKIKFQNEKLTISELENEIDIKQLVELTINSEQLILKKSDQNHIRIDNLKIDFNTSNSIETFLNKKNNLGLKIIKNVY